MHTENLHSLKKISENTKFKGKFAKAGTLEYIRNIFLTHSKNDLLVIILIEKINIKLHIYWKKESNII